MAEQVKMQDLKFHCMIKTTLIAEVVNYILSLGYMETNVENKMFSRQV